VILVDANLLIYAINRDAPHHRQAAAWLEDTLSGTTPLGLPWITMLAFLRITTRAGILRKPLAPERAIAFLDSMLAQPFVSFVAPGERHWPILRNLLQVSGTGGNLTSDAHLAALAIEHGYTIYSTDNDFRRFAGLSVINPITP
jgi:toxin-antitoxin system PIN domain toxin